MQVVKQLLGSKKFIAALVGTLVPILNAAFGWDLGVDQIMTIIAPISAYVVGQGLADFGKHQKE